MKERRRILEAFEFLEKKKNTMREKKFRESCAILRKYIGEAYNNHVITGGEAKNYGKRLKKLMGGV
ncbi:MAG: hypothetical protein U9N35_05190 [Euryarchaeota archaeon]|nr:hypothetical protein [Euryarchaeota archaeon]